MNSQNLREKFIQFFVAKDHKKLPSSSLIPEDQSVLFTTAGMQQFKKYYTSPQSAPAKNVVTFQTCFRTSDIDEVGDDTHLTFFEMLGNFSFGGYFKKESITFAYEFLTKVLEIDPARISCSVFAGDEINPRDDESVKILEEMKLPYKEHSREDNFWGPTGEEGPCGPTVEFYIDNLEVWNLVFNQYYRDKDGIYKDLETKGIDTGLGLERMLAVSQGISSVYETDLFSPIIEEIEKISSKKLQDCQKEFRIICDHAKAAVFALRDQIYPSNKERGYVVRRLIRRAIVKADQIGINENFTQKLAQKVFEIYEGVYQFDRQMILNQLEQEENKFRKTLKIGLNQLHKNLSNLSGEMAFNLYQTYGFPWEMTVELARENKIEIDKQEFESAFNKHQELSRTASAGMFKGGLANQTPKTIQYHTATHLLLAALRQVLGNQVRQRGSNITEERLRLDFSYSEKVEDQDLKKVEDLVNAQIQADLTISAEEMSLEDAKNCGAIGEFGEKYGFKVKVYSMDKFSREICGGPHVNSTGELGHFKILKEESSSQGVRRIKAILE